MSERTFDARVLGDLLVVRMAGVRPHDDGEYFHGAVGAWSRIAELSERHGVARVLVHIELAGESTSARAYAVSSALDQIKLSRGLRVALVNADPRTRVHTAFAVKIANARGWTAEVFASEAQARQWLAAATLAA